MARPLRIEYGGAFYHITARGNERKKIFYARSDYERFKVYLRRARKRYGCLLHCYALMGNHYHLILETPEANLSQIMHYLNSSYTSYFNTKVRRSGHLFQGRFKAIVVDCDSYLLQLSRYVHLNPVRGKLVERPEEYMYSSYRSYIGEEEDEIVYQELILRMISSGTREAAQQYRKFVEEGMRGTEDPLREVYGGIILGGEGFREEVLCKIKRDEVESEDISNRKALRRMKGGEEVIEEICRYFRVGRDACLSRKGIYRKITIYMMKRNTGLTNRQIGEMCGNISSSAVTRVCERFTRQMENDANLREKIEDIESLFVKCQGLTP